MRINAGHAKPSPSQITLGFQLIRIVIQISSIIIFSNLFPPPVFGIFALIAIVMGAGEVLRDFGLGSTGLSSRDLSDQASSNLFWLSTAFGGILAIVVALLSPAFSTIFSQDLILLLQPIVALNLLVNGFQIQFQVRLAHEGKYFLLGISEVIAQIFGLALALTAFILNFGFWSLAIQLVSTPLALAAIRALGSSWRPKRPRDLGQTIALLKVSSRYGLGQIFSYLARNVDNLMIGLFWGNASLGQYSRAFQLQSLPLIGALWPLTNVFVPRLVQIEKKRLSSDSELLGIQFKIGLASVTFFSTLAACGNILLPMVLGKEWDIVANLFVFLALAGCIESLNFVTYWRFLTHGAGRQYLVYSIIAGIFSVSNIIASAFVGPTQVAIAIAVNQAIYWATGLLVQKIQLGLSPRPFFVQGSLLLMSGIIAFGCGKLVQNALLASSAPLPLIIVVQSLASLALIVISLSCFRLTRTFLRKIIGSIFQKISLR